MIFKINIEEKFVVFNTKIAILPVKNNLLKSF